MTNKVEHNDIGKHPDVIKKAQQELLNMDVLVCGACRSTYHFVEEFSEHKRKCGSVKQQPLEKPDLKTNWAFQLWKSSQPSHVAENVWKLYKTWATMDEKQRSAWTTAGQSIQSISRLGTGAVQETVVKVMRTITDGAKPAPVTAAASIVANRNAVAARRAAGMQVKNDDEDTNTDEDYASPKTLGLAASRKTSISPVKTPRRYLVKRTMSASGNTVDAKECFAERATARRMNTNRNCYEYNVKWCDYPATWEPRSHFEKSPELLVDLERMLVKAKPVQAAIPTAAARPVRNSKARAVDQVKQWCTTEDGGSAISADLKRKNADSDYAEAEDSSQDEAAGLSPSPRKQIKSSPQIVQKVVGAGGQVRYYQKSLNGAANQVNAAEVVVTTSADKATGVVRKPGVTPTSPTKKEPQVKVVGKNEVTNSGIVRVGTTTGSALPGTPRMQRVVQTVRTPGQPTVTRTVLRQVPQPVVTPSPVGPKQGLIRQPVGATTPVTRNQYQVKRGTTPGTPAVTAKVSPAATPRPVRSPAGQTPPSAGPTTRVVRRTLTKPEASPVAAESDTTMTLCPVTGKLISAKDETNSELQRLLTNEEEEQAAGDSSQEGTSDGQGATEDGKLQQLIANEDGSPVLVTGEDGTIYQVAGRNADGQTLLIAQGTGEQACVYLASEEGGDATVASSDTTTETQVATEGTDTASGGDAETAQAQEGSGAEDGQSQAMLVDQDSQDGQITAELVQADEPSADGTRRVVLLLPDGNLMVTEVNEEQYQQFNLGS